MSILTRLPCPNVRKISVIVIRRRNIKFMPKSNNSIYINLINLICNWTFSSQAPIKFISKLYLYFHQTTKDFNAITISVLNITTLLSSKAVSHLLYVKTRDLWLPVMAMIPSSWRPSSSNSRPFLSSFSEF